MPKSPALGAALLLLWGSSAHAYAVADLLGEKFYQVAERNDSGPTVRAGLNYLNPFGVYANTHAVFQRDGYSHNFATGYRTSLRNLSLGASYNATQLQFQNQDFFYGVSQFTASFPHYSYRYAIADTYREQENSLNYSVLDVLLQGKFTQTEEMPASSTPVDSKKITFSARKGRGELQYVRTDRLSVQTHDYVMTYLWNRQLNTKWHFQRQGDYSTADATLSATLSKKTLASLRVVQNRKDGNFEKRMHSVAINTRLKHTQLEWVLSDAAPGLDGSAFLIKYRKQIVF